MGDALLAEDQADLAGKGTERELIELPHARAALARRRIQSTGMRGKISASDIRAAECWPWRGRGCLPSRSAAFSSAFIIAGKDLAIAFRPACMRGTACADLALDLALEIGIARRSCRGRSAPCRRRVGSRPSTAACISPTGMSIIALVSAPNILPSVWAMAGSVISGGMAKSLSFVGSAATAGAASSTRGEGDKGTHRPNPFELTGALSAIREAMERLSAPPARSAPRCRPGSGTRRRGRSRSG